MKNELNVRHAMSRDNVPVSETEQMVAALVEIKGGSAEVFGARPANVALVLDRSGSMDGEKLDRVKEAVGYVMDHMKDEDLVSITIFDDMVETLVSSRRAKDRDEIKAKIGSIIARGGTQISDGLRAGLEEIRKGYAKERVNSILLLTDGQTWDDEDACLIAADEAAKENISITSIGIGEDWNEKLLLQLADRSRGNSHWIENPISILDAFQQEVDGLQAVAATNLTLTARMGEGVKPIKVYATVPMIVDLSTKAVSGDSFEVKLGSLDGTRGQTVLLEMRLPGGKNGPFRVGRIEVAYDDPAGGPRRSVASDLSVVFTRDAAAASKVNAEVMNLMEKVSAFKLQTRALSEAEAGNIAAATKKLQSAATVLLDLGEDELAEAAEREILTLQKTGSLSPAGTKKLEYGTRKLTRSMTGAIK
jgi:Ca-activated chloride channel homolog